MQAIATERRMRFAGHILRLPEQRHAKKAINWNPLRGVRERGRPKITWRKTFTEDLSTINRTLQNINEDPQTGINGSY